MNIFKNANFNFLRWRWYAMGLSLLVIGAGAVRDPDARAFRSGVEFSGGTNLIVRFSRAGVRGSDSPRPAGDSA